jgi:serine/threonine-protein kinase
MELLVVKAGGTATCTFSSNVDCAQVWESDFAGRVHDLSGLPVAALGLEWSVTAFALSLWLVYRVVQGGELTALTAAVKVWAALGLLTCITLGVATARIGVFCPSCATTYALTAAFAAAAFLGLPDDKPLELALLLKALPRALLIAVPLHGALLYPASRTPKSTGTALAAHGSGPTEEQVLQYFQSLPPPEAQATADARAEWLAASVPSYPTPPTRQRYGPADAPVKLVEFTDVLCGHCRALIGMLGQLKKAVPAGRISIEPRYFPLDGECNPHAGQPRGDGIRCLGAKVQICLEGRPEYWDVRDQIFEHQTELDVEKLYALATSKGLSRPELDACIAAPATAARLQEDIAWAMAYGIDGTPLVLINGKAAPGVGPLLFGLAMSNADPNSKYFAMLPPAR